MREAFIALLAAVSLPHLRQHSHYWWVGQRRRATCPASTLPRRLPRRNREIERRQTLLRALAVMRQLRKVCRDWLRACQKLRSNTCRSYYGFLFISTVRDVSIPTPYSVFTVFAHVSTNKCLLFCKNTFSEKRALCLCTSFIDTVQHFHT